eukprot:Em0053g16a
MATNYAADLIYFFDDFLLAGPPGQPTCIVINLALEAALASCISFLLSEYVLPVAVVALTEIRTSERDHKPSHDRLMLKATITLGFFGLLRVSEFTVPNQHGFNPDQLLTAKDITMHKDSMIVVIKKSKTDQRGGKLPDQHRSDTHQVLPTPRNSEIPRFGYSTKLYHTHSLRIGAATAVARSGLSPATIKNLGRWWSEAYKVYTCHPLTQL